MNDYRTVPLLYTKSNILFLGSNYKNIEHSVSRNIIEKIKNL
jgi:hypothetical protein